MDILEVELHSSDITATEKFYKKILDVEPYHKEQQTLLFYQIGGTKLIFKATSNRKPVYHFAIEIPNNLFLEAYRVIKERVELLPVQTGGTIADFANWNAKSFYFYDNNGNIVEVITRNSKKNSGSMPFTNESFINISEIGFADDNVPALAAYLWQEFGIPNYINQPPRDNFTVVGNENGLFILAQKGRHWYPTAVQSHQYPLRVLFINDGNVNHIIRE
ncbi:VOC family protein [Flavobacterium rhizosphaerae]|uniref:VOC domain-containing protein n=1 Tax=Flavobacterium rhizosphaerae TaxID=3163298 RepID=A0ABW8YYF2_9FLAO